MPVPVVVHKGYEPPELRRRAHAGVRRLVLGQHRGDRRGRAPRRPPPAAAWSWSSPAAASSAALADAWGAPRVPIADGIPMPRAGIGAVAVPPLVVLERVGPVPRRRRRGSTPPSTSCARRRDQLVADGNPAERLARRIGRHDADRLRRRRRSAAVAAMRWKTQFNENAKVPAFCQPVPELCHNEICGWGQHGDVTRRSSRWSTCATTSSTRRSCRRFDLVDAVHRRGRGRHRRGARPRATAPLAQLLDLVLFGDFVSLHLAAEEGVDPGPIPVLDDLKAALGPLTLH